MGIASIKPGQYWSTADEAPQTPGYMTTIMRTINRCDNRFANLQDIRNTVDLAFMLIAEATDPRIINHMVSCVMASVFGIMNLKTIYYDCDVMKSQIDLTITQIRDRCTEFEADRAPKFLI